MCRNPNVQDLHVICTSPHAASRAIGGCPRHVLVARAVRQTRLAAPSFPLEEEGIGQANGYNTIWAAHILSPRTVTPRSSSADQPRDHRNFVHSWIFMQTTHGRVGPKESETGVAPHATSFISRPPRGEKKKNCKSCRETRSLLRNDLGLHAPSMAGASRSS